MTPVRVAIAAVALVIVFVVGIAVGKALNDNSQPGGTQTIVRTLDPLPLAPARVTVTVTTTNP
ncbi:MAG TPA: hypothetical protein VFW85_06710 [Gaiellaceae bacterium]|nr:hypothetical protein [Gaiellaceae bacterium]